MPFDFFYIPLELQGKVVEKMGITDFVNFEKSAKGASAAIDCVPTRVIADSKSEYSFGFEEKTITIAKTRQRMFEPLYWIRSKIRLHQIKVYLQSRLTEEFAVALVNFFRTTQSSANSIHGSLDPEGCHLEPNALENFLNAFQGLEEIGLRNLNVGHLQIPAMKHLLHIKAPLEDEDFFALNAITLVCCQTNITCRGLNFFIKEVIKGTRPLLTAYITTTEGLDKTILFKDICEVTTRDSYCIKTDDARIIRVTIRSKSPVEKIILISAL